MATEWADFQQRFAWRPSQRHLLERAALVRDQRWHICAPPGAGKTLIGLELARQVGHMALVLTPTVAIRDQWRSSVTSFAANPDSFVGDRPCERRQLTAMTYQMLSSPGRAGSDLRHAAERLWISDLTRERGDGAARVLALRTAEPRRAERELASRVRVLRRMIAGETDLPVPLSSLLGERVETEVEALVHSGVRTVILDECHHLLDWWALVVTALVDRLVERHGPDGVAVIGLTATLPDPDGAFESRNYQRLLGDVDVELYLPALVAEGAIAPWRDCVLFVTPTAAEQAFLDDAEHHLVQALDTLLAEQSFAVWAVERLVTPTLDATFNDPTDSALIPNADADVVPHADADADAWIAFWNSDPLAAEALTGWWHHCGRQLPAGFEPPTELAGYRSDQRLLLLEMWLNAGDAQITAGLRGEARTVLARHGLAITSTGVSTTRGVADIVAARSDAKASAAVRIVECELAERSGSARSLVVVEANHATTPPAAARAALGRNSGTAHRVFEALCASPHVVNCGVVCVSGTGVWADVLVAEHVVRSVNLDAGSWELAVRGCTIEGAVELVDGATSWASAEALAVVRRLVSDGVIGTVVSTRGLVGEGWDCPALNVLVDLSEAASPTSVTQLRGRVIRLDPAEPQKVASLWDVVVLHEAARGEWRRFVRRHQRWWGVDNTAQVVTGHRKLDARLRMEPPPAEVAEAISADALASAGHLDPLRAAWAAVDPSGDGHRIVTVRSRRRRRVAVRRRHWRRWLAAGAGAGVAGIVAMVTAVALQPLFVVPAALASVSGIGCAWWGSTSRSADQRRRLIALGEAVRDGLVKTGERDLAAGSIEIRIGDADELSCTINGVDESSADLWAEQFAECVGPVGQPRWLVAIGPEEAWRVPSKVGARREAAEQFSSSFRSRFPGARLHRAGTSGFAEVVLTQSRLRPDTVREGALWV